MSKNSKIIIIVIAVFVIFGGLWFFLESGDDTTLTNSEDTQQTASSETANDSSQTQETKELEESTDATAGAYVDYSEEKVANAQGDRVLFFHASWCPTCKSLDQNIRAGVVPDGLTIFKVDYDTERELAKKHGVTYQHTLVQVDEKGEQLNKWAGSYTIDQIVDELI